jgi:DNA-binding transcriptional regulator YdaS (Cro superfamily)
MLSKSRKYIQSLSKNELAALAANLGTKPVYLYQIGKGFRTPSRRLALKMEQEAKGKIKASDFDDLLIANS